MAGKDWNNSQRALDEVIANFGAGLAHRLSKPPGEGYIDVTKHIPQASGPARNPLPTMESLRRHAIEAAQAALEVWQVATLTIEEAYYAVLVAWSARRSLEEFRDRPADEGSAYRS